MTDATSQSELQQTAIDAGNKYTKCKDNTAKAAITCGRALNAVKKADPKGFNKWVTDNMKVKERQCQKFMAIADKRDDAWLAAHSGAEFLGINAEARLVNVPPDIEKHLGLTASLRFSSPKI